MLWHSFLWSYDRLPYTAAFLAFNNFKTMVCSHTATAYHQITTFLPNTQQPEGWGTHSVISNDERFQQVANFFQDHEALQKMKISTMEIFSSPTN